MDTRGRRCYDRGVMNIVLFGAGSRLGTALRRVLTQHAFVCPSRADVDVLSPDSVRAYLAAHPADVVVNCIAYNKMDDAETNQAEAERVNADVPAILSAAAAERGLPFVHFSTDCEFDGTKKEGYAEDDAPHPISVYGSSKAHGTQRALAANPKAYVVRVSRLYGKPGTSPNAKRSFVEIILDQASKEPSFEVNDGEVSAPNYVDDIARHLDAYVLSGKAKPGIYHLANEGGATWYEWAKAIVEIKKLPNEIKPRVPTARPAKRPDYAILLSTKIPPMRPWREALADYLK